jgi:cell division transport system permease protein
LRRWTYVLSEAVAGLVRNGLMTIAVILSVAVSLTLLGGFELIRREVQLITGDWLSQIEVSIFLCDGQRDCAAITEEQQDELLAQLEREPVVEEITYESKDEAYERFNELFQNQPEMIENVSPGALPASFRIRLADPENFDVIADRFSGAPGVEAVVDQSAVFEEILALTRGVQIAALTIALVQLVAGAVLIANTIQVAAFARREQTQVMKLVGASNWYIRLPFVLEGALAAAIGGGLATLGLWVAHPIAQEGVTEAVQFVPFILRSETLEVGLVITGIGVALAVVASLLSLQRSLDV